MPGTSEQHRGVPTRHSQDLLKVAIGQGEAVADFIQRVVKQDKLCGIQAHIQLVVFPAD
jgi:hypothetical protein